MSVDQNEDSWLSAIVLAFLYQPQLVSLGGNWHPIFTFQDSWKTTFPWIDHAQNLSTYKIYFDKCFITKTL
jgi:hypothetical protein